VLYLLIAVVVGAVGIAVVVLRHRGPRSVAASIDRFERERSAISPESSSRVAPPAPGVVRPDQRRRQPAGPRGPTRGTSVDGPPGRGVRRTG
jgi:hypothetical protein